MELFQEMFTNPIAMWVFIIFALGIMLISVYAFIIESGIFDFINEKIMKLRDKIGDKKREHEQELWKFNLFIMMFGGIAVIFILIGESIQRWWIRHKWNVILFLINVVFILPIILRMTDVIRELPEFFYPIFLFYVLIMFAVLVSRADNKRSGYDHRHYNYNDQYNHTPNKSSYVYKPKPRGLSVEQARIKKEKIREKLKENKNLQEKYEL